MTAPVSPTVVDMILITQKASVTSGTLLSMVLGFRLSGFRLGGSLTCRLPFRIGTA